MGDEEDTDEPKAMQFAKMDVPEAYMATNDEELVLKMEQVRSTHKMQRLRASLQRLESLLCTIARVFSRAFLSTLLAT